MQNCNLKLLNFSGSQNEWLSFQNVSTKQVLNSHFPPFDLPLFPFLCHLDSQRPNYLSHFFLPPQYVALGSTRDTSSLCVTDVLFYGQQYHVSSTLLADCTLALRHLCGRETKLHLKLYLVCFLQVFL